jgi:PTH1 family peptidyl-tRNA hydrolase
MKACFGTADFWRLRIGVGRPGGKRPEHGRMNTGEDIAGWVLRPLSEAEISAVGASLSLAKTCLDACLASEPETLLAEWKKVSVPAKP